MEEEYKKLLDEYRALQLRVTRFSATEQELINTRDKLDHELEQYKRLQQLTQKAIRKISPHDLINTLLEGIVDVVETEVAMILIKGPESKSYSVYTEGLSLKNDENRSIAIILESLLHNIKPHVAFILESSTIQEQYPGLPFDSFLCYRVEVEDHRYSFLVLAGNTNKNAPLFPILENRLKTLFDILCHQAESIFLNQLRSWEIQRAKKELHQLSFIATQTPNAVVIANRQGQIDWINHAFTQMTGYSLREVKGKKPGEFLHGPDTDKNIIEEIRKALRQKESVEKTIINYKKDGEPFVNQLQITPVKDATGNVVNYISLERDITSIKKTEKELINKNEELKKINAELDNFVYSVSHDLRSPLLSIKGLLGLILHSHLVSEEVAGYLKMAETSINRLDGTIKDILEYSRNARTEVMRQEVDVQKLCEFVFQELRDDANPPITLKTKITGSSQVITDRNRLGALLKNLMSNAIKYAKPNHPDAYVEVVFINHGNTFECFVNDNGMGISEEYQSKVFDMFFRGHAGSSGTGLGLYIVKEIVQKMGGNISLSSSPGKGTSVHLSLPSEKTETKKEISIS
ncbi:MAG: ATP-binding protein [Bacteroidota bacterium]|jgi:PAS domain S-box-containing protein